MQVLIVCVQDNNQHRSCSWVADTFESRHVVRFVKEVQHDAAHDNANVTAVHVFMGGEVQTFTGFHAVKRLTSGGAL